jgi:hypothetical protein
MLAQPVLAGLTSFHSTVQPKSPLACAGVMSGSASSPETNSTKHLSITLPLPEIIVQP